MALIHAGVGVEVDDPISSNYVVFYMFITHAGVSREVFAVFMQPEWGESMDVPRYGRVAALYSTFECCIDGVDYVDAVGVIRSVTLLVL